MPKTPDPAPAPSPGEGTILVVDDLPQLRTVARIILESEGYGVLEAATGEEALEVLREQGQRVTAVLLDQTMPGMGGERALAEIHALFPEMGVVRTSGYSVDLDTAPGPGRVHVLGKPFGASQLLEAIRAVLD